MHTLKLSPKDCVILCFIKSALLQTIYQDASCPDKIRMKYKPFMSSECAWSQLMLNKKTNDSFAYPINIERKFQ